METASGLPIRKSVRLKQFHYAGGAMYFVTICSALGQCVFGTCQDAAVALSRIGTIVQEEWLRTGHMRAGVILGRHIVMPNHFHGVLFLPDESSGERSSPLHRLRDVIGGFKSAVTRRCREEGLARDLWQRGFHDHVIRTERARRVIEKYIDENPAQWDRDPYHPDRVK